MSISSAADAEPAEPENITHVVDDFDDIEKQDLNELRFDTGKRNEKKTLFLF